MNLRLGSASFILRECLLILKELGIVFKSKLRVLSQIPVMTGCCSSKKEVKNHNRTREKADEPLKKAFLRDNCGLFKKIEISSALSHTIFEKR